ncbi:hypothetical protein ABW44_07155 [Stenotrophomonas maltophilia]|nr:hypothetical protein ABW44_07155 [Stenotrophomonas maltophilia]
MDRIPQLLDQDESMRLEVSTLAEGQGVLSQLTRECFGQTRKALIDHQVVLEIKAWLSYSELPIGRIAERLCFEDASYLCRYFRRHTGQSLTAYRRAGQGLASGIRTAVPEPRPAGSR